MWGSLCVVAAWLRARLTIARPPASAPDAAVEAAPPAWRKQHDEWSELRARLAASTVDQERTEDAHLDRIVRLDAAGDLVWATDDGLPPRDMVYTCPMAVDDEKRVSCLEVPKHGDVLLEVAFWNDSAVPLRVELVRPTYCLRAPEIVFDGQVCPPKGLVRLARSPAVGINMLNTYIVAFVRFSRVKNGQPDETEHRRGRLFATFATLPHPLRREYGFARCVETRRVHAAPDAEDATAFVAATVLPPWLRDTADSLLRRDLLGFLKEEVTSLSAKCFSMYAKEEGRTEEREWLREAARSAAATWLMRRDRRAHKIQSVWLAYAYTPLEGRPGYERSCARWAQRHQEEE